MNRSGAVIFHPATGPSVVEQLVGSARAAAAGDLIDALAEHFSRTIVVTVPECRADFESLAQLALHVVGEDETAFHFGETLKRVIREFELTSLAYFGSGSGVLLSEDDRQTLVRFAGNREPAALFNNFYSCDFAAFSDAKALLTLPLPATDNGVGFLLADAGMRCYALPRSASTQFDLDTPTDVLLLKAADRGGRRVRALLGGLPLHHPTLAGVCDVLVERTALAYLVGRISPTTWQAFEGQVACRTAGIVEGRGMKAYADRHPVVLPRLLRELDIERFFHALENGADAAIIDTRPLLAEDGQLPPARERFASDLFRVSELTDPRWIDFTRAAEACAIPVLLGGHSLVSGGLYLLSEICWKGRHLPRRLHPDPYSG